MLDKEEIEKINKKLDMTEDDEITINLLYRKCDLQEDYIEQLETEIKQKEERIDYLQRSCDRKEQSLIEEQQENVDLETEIQQLKDKIKALGKGQQTLIKSRAKWKARYYKERNKVKKLEGEKNNEVFNK